MPGGPDVNEGFDAGFLQSAPVNKQTASVDPPPRPQRHPDGASQDKSRALQAQIAQEIADRGGWMGFERFMELALYAPGLGYYTRGSQVFGALPQRDGSDFITAPELSPLFAGALARQIEQALTASACTEIWEFGAGSGILASQLLQILGPRISRYHIVDLSAALVERQRDTVARIAGQHLDKLHFVQRLPAALQGVVIGNEVLDAMPVTLLYFDGTAWFERGVAVAGSQQPLGFVWADRATDLRLPLDGPFVPGTVTELPRLAPAFIRTLATTLQRGAAFFIDYGFPQAEYYHPQRSGGTLMCHRGHLADPDPLVDVGSKDITSHVDFTAIGLAAQDSGLDVLGYTSQARFLLNCGLVGDLEHASLRERADAQKLMLEHEMGELFKVIGLSKGISLDALGFSAGDRTHRL